MAQIIEKFLPALIKTVQRNKGILDQQEAARIFSIDLVKLAIKNKVVTERYINLDVKGPQVLRIPCITFEWDGSKPEWLTRYRKETSVNE